MKENKSSSLILVYEQLITLPLFTAFLKECSIYFNIRMKRTYDSNVFLENILEQEINWIVIKLF